jgi:hypothetical protein
LLQLSKARLIRVATEGIYKSAPSRPFAENGRYFATDRSPSIPAWQQRGDAGDRPTLTS